MPNSAFFVVEFYLIVIITFILPIAIYIYLLKKPAIATTHVLAYGFLLVCISTFNVYLLRQLRDIAKASPNLTDDQIFVSELSLALYILPAIFAGIGINIISHVLIRHLERAEKRQEDNL